MVSEYMLQQTQVSRVIPKYQQWMKTFPTLQSLSKAPLSKVLLHWSGLGYNRRARALHEASKTIFVKYKNKFPKDTETLITLPGVGAYTARAILTFSFGAREIFIETNIRTVFIHFFFDIQKEKIADELLLEVITQSLPSSDLCTIQEWYWALMDYGSYLKLNGNRSHQKSTHFKKQSTFQGSKRQVRGAIIKMLSKGESCTSSKLKKLFPHQKDSIAAIINTLIDDGLVVKNKGMLQLP